MFNIKEFFFPSKPKVGDFILTKKFKNKKGIDKGNIVVRVEHVVNNNYLCSKGRFEIHMNPKRLEWEFEPNQKLIQISLYNVARKLDMLKAYSLLQERLKNK